MSLLTSYEFRNGASLGLMRVFSAVGYALFNKSSLSEDGIRPLTLKPSKNRFTHRPLGVAATLFATYLFDESGVTTLIGLGVLGGALTAEKLMVERYKNNISRDAEVFS